MSVITMPDVCPDNIVWSIKSSTRVHSSPFTGFVQSMRVPAESWSAKVNYPIMNNSDARLMRGFLASLNGQQNRFYLQAYDYTTGPSSSVTGAATKDTNALTLSGSVTLDVGAYIQIGDELKIVTSGSGTSYDVSPPFRDTHTTSAVETENPKCLMMLASPNVSWDASPYGVYQYSFEAIEALS